MKTVFLVADGMAGWPLDALGGALQKRYGIKTLGGRG